VNGAVATDVSQEMANLLYGYAELMDAGNFAAIGELLADAVVSMEGSHKTTTGADAITAEYQKWSQIYETGTPKTKHIITNLIVAPDDTGDSVQARSYFTVLQAVEGVLPLQPILAGRYRHSFTRIDGEWRCTAMHVVWDLVGTLTAHLKPDAS
jgi:ketosteroid isomerase-like protein